MRSRLSTHEKNTRIQTQELSAAPVTGMFQPRPFGKPSPVADSYQQPDLKTSLMRAERYGHHLSQMHDTDVSAPQVTQPKMGRERSIQSEPAALLSSKRVQSIGGRPLPKPVRQKMEMSFGSDFSNVRVHEGSEAESIGAVAYTQGSHIHFQPGQYNPTSQSGQQLIGHELTHVVQQRTGQVSATTQAQGLPVNDQQQLEVQADKLGEMAARGESVSGRIGGTVSSSGGIVQCKVDVVQCARLNVTSQDLNRKRPRKLPTMKGNDKYGLPLTAHHKLGWSAYIKPNTDTAINNPNNLAAKDQRAVHNQIANWADTNPTSSASLQNNSQLGWQDVTWAPHNIFMGPLGEIRADDPSKSGSVLPDLDTHFTRSGTVTPKSELALDIAHAGGLANFDPAELNERLAALPNLDPSPYEPDEWREAKDASGNIINSKQKDARGNLVPMVEQEGQPLGWEKWSSEDRVNYAKLKRQEKEQAALTGRRRRYSFS